MIAIVSPAKTLDFDKKYDVGRTKARFFDQSKDILEVLKQQTEADLQHLMDISDSLAALNVERYQKFSSRHTDKNSKQSLFAFQGDVYQGLQADDFTPEDIAFAQDHFRILSGLYGLLRPLDAIQPYRLEMGTSLKVNGSNNLYDFWGETIAKAINKDLRAQGDKVLVNLASIEYFKSVNRKALKARVIDVEFLDFKNGDYKIISFFAKKARGLMSRYIIKNQLSNPEDLKGFDYDGYYFDAGNSTENALTFKRG